MAPLLAEIRTDEAEGDARLAQRRTIRLQVQTASSQDATRALIHNLSEYGLLIETAVRLQGGDVLHVDLPEVGSTAALIVWTRGAFFGCEFISPVPKAAVSAALLRSPAKTSAHPQPKFPFAEVANDHLEADIDQKPSADHSLVVILSLLLALSVVTIFIVALLRFPFSS